LATEFARNNAPAAALIFAATLAGCGSPKIPPPPKETPVQWPCSGSKGPLIVHTGGRSALEVQVKMDVDVDGAPNAYGPPGFKTLDIPRHARAPNDSKHPGEIVGYMTEYTGGPPTVQVKGDPFPGYYVSQTDFADIHNLRMEDPRRYVDARIINYVVQGKVAREGGVQLGDFAVVYSCRTRRAAYAIVADSGNESGAEGSLALVRALGYDIKDGIDHSVDDPEIVIRYFPHSNPAQQFFKTQAELDVAVRKLGLRD
jgi:hypothetical protein